MTVEGSIQGITRLLKGEHFMQNFTQGDYRTDKKANGTHVRRVAN